MKKLYAKTSFAYKKANGKQGKTATGTESDPDEIQRYPSPIMAYRQNGNSGSGGVNFDTATVNKTPKMARAASATLHDEIESRRSISPPMSLDSNQSYYRVGGNEAAHHYYSIGDLEHVQQLNWQQQQRLRQQEFRRRRLTNTPVLTAPLRPFHQHTKMVLQLPKANNGGEATPTKTTSPIYELPRITLPFQHMDTTTNGFASLPPDLNHRDMNGSNVVFVASAKGEEAVSSINSVWQGNANNKHDKCLSTTTKTMLQHSQSMPMSRKKPTSNHQQNAHFYQHNSNDADADADAEQQQIELQNMQHNNSYKKSELHMTLPIQRHNSVKENYISRPNNGVAVMQTYVHIYVFFYVIGEIVFLLLFLMYVAT